MEAQIHIEKEAEIVVMLPQARELAARNYRQPPETGKRTGRTPA